MRLSLSQTLWLTKYFLNASTRMSAPSCAWFCPYGDLWRGHQRVGLAGDWSEIPDALVPKHGSSVVIHADPLVALCIEWSRVGTAVGPWSHCNAATHRDTHHKIDGSTGVHEDSLVASDRNYTPTSFRFQVKQYRSKRNDTMLSWRYITDLKGYLLRTVHIEIFLSLFSRFRMISCSLTPSTKSDGTNTVQHTGQGTLTVCPV